MVEGQACANCKFWDRGPKERSIENCRRYAPRPMGDPKMRNWSLTRKDDWCGEWETAD